MKFYIFLLVINFIVVVIYVIWNHLRGKEKNLSTWMKAIVMLLCPVVGPTFLCAAFLLYKLFMSQAMGSFRCCFQQRESQNLYSSG